MLIARWNIDVRFGQKNNFISAYKKWSEEVGNKVGLSKDKLRVAAGSIGVNESRFECEYNVESLEQLQRMWEDMSTMEAHQQFGKDLEPIIVSGSNRWEVFRVVDF
jgi:hypothetical protein